MKRQGPVRWLGLGTVVVVLLASAAVSARANAGGRGRNASDWKHNDGNGDCSEVAQDQSLACKNSALESYWLAIARCDNAAGEDAAGACPKAAGQEFRAARKQCGEQLDARRQICDQLGGGKYDPAIDPADFSTDITNPLFPLKPGTTFIYEGDTANGHEHVEFQVTHDTRVLDGVTCVAVHDAVTTDGQLTEDTIDWFAQDKAGTVWYFGEDSRRFEDGVLVSIDGSWRAGVDDAKPGIIMQANPKLGDVYRQELAISEAEDMAEVVGLNQPVSVPFVSSSHALVTHEFSGLEPGASERKFYVPNVGNVLTIDDVTGERSELMNITH